MSKPIKIFRAGTHTSTDGRVQTITVDDLLNMAEKYDPSKHEAPLVIGHPASNDPAYGWVKRLSVERGDLVAHPQQIDSALIEMVEAGKFKYISAAFYPPDSPSNPVPGGFYLRHVGFLGAQAPAVKGLGAVAFKEADNAGVLSFHEPLHKDNTMPDQEAAQRAAALQQKEEALKARELQFAEREQKLQQAEAAKRQQEHVAFSESMIKEGRLLPMHQPRMVALLTALDGQGNLEFAEASKTLQIAPAQILKEFLSALPPQVEFAERGQKTATTPQHTYITPAGYSVDPDGLALHQKALNYADSHKTDYLTAVMAVNNQE